MRFHVIDNDTGRKVDYEAIRSEEWAKDEMLSFVVYDFYLGENGDLLLVNNCGCVVEPPEGRFTVVFDVPKARWKMEPNHAFSVFDLHMDAFVYICSRCNTKKLKCSKFCPECGAWMESDGEKCLEERKKRETEDADLSV